MLIIANTVGSKMFDLKLNTFYFVSFLVFSVTVKNGIDANFGSLLGIPTQLNQTNASLSAITQRFFGPYPSSISNY